MTKEEIISKFRTYLYRAHNFKHALSNEEIKAILGDKLYEALRNIDE